MSTLQLSLEKIFFQEYYFYMMLLLTFGLGILLFLFVTHRLYRLALNIEWRKTSTLWRKIYFGHLIILLLFSLRYLLDHRYLDNSHDKEALLSFALYYSYISIAIKMAFLLVERYIPFDSRKYTIYICINIMLILLDIFYFLLIEYCSQLNLLYLDINTFSKVYKHIVIYNIINNPILEIKFILIISLGLLLVIFFSISISAFFLLQKKNVDVAVRNISLSGMFIFVLFLGLFFFAKETEFNLYAKNLNQEILIELSRQNLRENNVVLDANSGLNALTSKQSRRYSTEITEAQSAETCLANQLYHIKDLILSANYVKYIHYIKYIYIITIITISLIMIILFFRQKILERYYHLLITSSIKGGILVPIFLILFMKILMLPQSTSYYMANNSIVNSAIIKSSLLLLAYYLLLLLLEFAMIACIIGKYLGLDNKFLFKMKKYVFAK